MCRSSADGGRRCDDARRFEALTARELAPVPDDRLPEVYWSDEDLAQLWAGAEDHAVVATAISRLQQIRDAEPEITHTLLEVAAAAGARMHGLEARMKSPASTTEKIRRKSKVLRGLSPHDVVARFTDLLRYTIVTEHHDELLPTAHRALGDLLGRGVEILELSSTYADGSPYKGLHAINRFPQTPAFELQFHSELSQSVKDEIHPHYEIARSIDAGEAERAAAAAACIRISARVPTPRGLDEASEIHGHPILRSFG
ncbi:MAG: hypothetical protein QM598_05945 [Protaetiibacter sp.]